MNPSNAPEGFKKGHQEKKNLTDVLSAVAKVPSVFLFSQDCQTHARVDFKDIHLKSYTSCYNSASVTVIINLRGDRKTITLTLCYDHSDRAACEKKRTLLLVVLMKHIICNY